MKFADDDETVTISLISSGAFSAVHGTLKRQKGQKLKGTMEVVYRGDRNGNAFTVPIVATLVDANTLQLRTEEPTFNRYRGKIGTQYLRHVWVKQTNNPPQRVMNLSQELSPRVFHPQATDAS